MLDATSPDSSDRSAPTVSLCMIVRDSEKSLRQALESAREFVDEMIVVDTGSRDGTIDIAREVGAKIYEFPWCDDFSAARNYSLDQATSDWIFWMDSDDVLPGESGRRLKEIIAKSPPDAAYWVDVEQIGRDFQNREQLTSHAHLKLFPRHPQIRFCYRVHEQVAPSIRSLGMPLKVSGARVQHKNADRSDEANNKRNLRNIRLLKMDLADSPEDPVVWMNLGMSQLRDNAALPAVVDLLKRAQSTFKTGSPLWVNTSHFLTTAYSRLGDREAEFRTLQEAWRQLPDDATLLLRLGMMHERISEVPEAIKYYRRIFASGKLHPAVLHGPGLRARAALRLGRCYVRVNERLQAERFWQAFLKEEPSALQVRRDLEASLLSACPISTHQRPRGQ